jgi:uncharacterized protein (TIGR03435 family)
MKSLIAIVLLPFGFVSAISSEAQAPPSTTTPSSFEVASIKPVAPANARRFATSGPNQFLATGYSLRGLIAFAYRLRQDQVLGGSGWMLSDQWEIQAKIKEGANPRRTGPLTAATFNEPDPSALMLQSLLADRFSLKMHHEKKEFPVYELVIAKGGLKMRLNEDPPVTTAQDPADFRGFAIQKGIIPRGVSTQSRGLFEGRGILLVRIVIMLSGLVDRTVIDKTGLDGEYDLKLQWAPDFNIDPGSFAGIAPITGQATTPSPFPSIFTALQEQLGLQLISTKAPLDVIVIDGVQKPSEN